MHKIRKGSIGATMTWVMATIIILVVMVVFIYLTEIIFTEQSIGKLVYSSDKINYFGVDSTQSILAFLNTNFNGKTLQQYIQEKDYNYIKENATSTFKILPENDFKNFLGYTLIINNSEEIEGFRDPNSFLAGLSGSVTLVKSFESNYIYFGSGDNIKFKKTVET